MVMAFLAATPAWAAAAGPGLTEADVLAAVVTDHPGLAAVRTRQAAAGRAADRSAGLPAPGFRFTVTGIDPTFATLPTAMLMAEQPIPLGGQRGAQAAAARAGAAVLAVEMPLAEGELRATARLAFATWRDLHARLEALTAQIRAGDTTLQALGRLIGSPRGPTPARLVRIQSEIESLRVEHEAVAAALPDAALRLNLLLGRPAGTPVPLPDLALPAFDLAAAEAASTLAAQADHPASRRLALQATAARTAARAEAAAGSAMLMPGAGVMTMPHVPVAFLVTVGVTLPRFGPGDGRIQAAVAQAAGEATALDQTAAATGRALAAALTEALGQVRQAQVRRSGWRDRVVPGLQRAFEATLPALATGGGTVGEVAEALRRLAEAELQRVDLDTQWLRARATWLALRETGGARASTPQPAAGTAATPMGDAGGMAGMGM